MGFISVAFLFVLVTAASQGAPIQTGLGVHPVEVVFPSKQFGATSYHGEVHFDPGDPNRADVWYRSSLILTKKVALDAVQVRNFRRLLRFPQRRLAFGEASLVGSCKFSRGILFFPDEGEVYAGMLKRRLPKDAKDIQVFASGDISSFSFSKEHFYRKVRELEPFHWNLRDSYQNIDEVSYGIQLAQNEPLIPVVILSLRLEEDSLRLALNSDVVLWINRKLPWIPVYEVPMDLVVRVGSGSSLNPSFTEDPFDRVNRLPEVPRGTFELKTREFLMATRTSLVWNGFSIVPVSQVEWMNEWQRKYGHDGSNEGFGRSICTLSLIRQIFRLPKPN